MQKTPRWKSRLLSLAAASMVAGPAIAAEPGITKDKIVIGAFMPLQGGLAAGANQMRDGADAYFQEQNAKGGINGRKIEWRVENDSYNPQQTIAVTKKLVDRDGVFAIVSTLGTATGLAVLPFLAQRKVPLINPAGGHALLNDPKDANVFGLLPLGPANGTVIANYALDKMQAKRIAVFFQNDQFGQDPRDGVNEVLKARGMTTVAEASYVPSDIDVSAQVIKLRDANPDVVVIAAIPKQGALFLQEAAKLGWKPKFIGLNTMGDPYTGELAGSSIDGVTVAIFTAVDTMPNEKVQEANKVILKYHPNTKPGYWTYLGYAGAAVFAEGAKIAGPELTREKLIAAIETMGDFQTGVVPPLSFGPGKHGGSNKFGIAQWQNGKLVVLEGW